MRTSAPRAAVLTIPCGSGRRRAAATLAEELRLAGAPAEASAEIVDRAPGGQVMARKRTS